MSSSFKFDSFNLIFALHWPPKLIRLSTNFMTFIPSLTFIDLWVVFMQHLWSYFTIPYGFSLFRHFSWLISPSLKPLACFGTFHLFKKLCLAQDHYPICAYCPFCNCCLIELFCDVVCVVVLPFWHFCWCRGFCHRTGSDLLLFVIKFNVKWCIHLSKRLFSYCNGCGMPAGNAYPSGHQFWFHPLLLDLLMHQLLRPVFSNLPCLFSTFHLEYP